MPKTSTTNNPTKKQWLVRYVWRESGKVRPGQTLWDGINKKAALAEFTRENPHILSAHIVA